jgi:hypothetical protein
MIDDSIACCIARRITIAARPLTTIAVEHLYGEPRESMRAAFERRSFPDDGLRLLSVC